MGCFKGKEEAEKETPRQKRELVGQVGLDILFHKDKIHHDCVGLRTPYVTAMRTLESPTYTQLPLKKKNVCTYVFWVCMYVG